MLTDAADSLAQVETVIQREGIECHWRMNGRFSGAFTPRHYAEQAAKVGTYNARPVSARTWCRASSSARRSLPTTTTAAWWWNAPASFIRRCTTAAC